MAHLYRVTAAKTVMNVSRLPLKADIFAKIVWPISYVAFSWGGANGMEWMCEPTFTYHKYRINNTLEAHHEHPSLFLELSAYQKTNHERYAGYPSLIARLQLCVVSGHAFAESYMCTKLCSDEGAYFTKAQLTCSISIPRAIWSNVENALMLSHRAAWSIGLDCTYK